MRLILKMLGEPRSRLMLALGGVAVGMVVLWQVLREDAAGPAVTPAPEVEVSATSVVRAVATRSAMVTPPVTRTPGDGSEESEGAPPTATPTVELAVEPSGTPEAQVVVAVPPAARVRRELANMWAGAREKIPIPRLEDGKWQLSVMK